MRVSMRLLAVLVAVPLTATGQDDAGSTGLGQVAAEQGDPARAAIEQGKALMERREYVQAAGLFFEQETSATEPELQDEATYLLGKSLYRLELYHGALDAFARVLELGPDGRYYQAALEWCLFIGRKMVDDASVSETLVKFGSTDFPSEYRDEFLFRLARYHANSGLRMEREAQRPMLTQKKGEGLSVSGDLFGSDDADASKSSGGGISVGGDLFGTGETTTGNETKSGSDGISVGTDLFGSGDATGAGKEEGGIELEVDVFGATPPSGAFTVSSHLQQAREYALRVNPDSEYGGRAKFIEAVVLFHDRKENEALKAFKDVVRLTRPDQPHPNARLRELAFFQLARTHFGASQPTFSIFYYNKVSRDSADWLAALFEESWAQFRLGNYEKALGNLLTLHAPFFADSYFPESRVLEAVIYYENCRYAEAKAILAAFMQRYEPLLEELRRLTQDNETSEQYLSILDGLKNDDLMEAESGDPVLLSRILELALADPDLARLDRSRDEVLSERSRIPDLGFDTRLAGELDAALTRKLDGLSAEAGLAVERRLIQERENIRSLIQQAVRIDIETARSEQERIESQLRAVQSRPKQTERTYVAWTDDEKLVWPFEGEYWRDELGTYELTLARSCR